MDTTAEFCRHLGEDEDQKGEGICVNVPHVMC